jgi:tetratricopeptide (TPR) repeat protein
MREDLRRELGEDWGKFKNTGTRVNLNDKQELLLSRALYLLSKFYINVSDVQNVIIGSTLSDSGRHGESLQFYKKAVDVASSRLSRAWARRAYGRALILSGDLERGRAELLTAAAEFERLKSERGFDADAMRYDEADAFRRLIWAEFQRGEKTYLQDDFNKLVALTTEIRNPDRRKTMEDSIAELRRVLQDQGTITRLAMEPGAWHCNCP